jgi:succinylarginine dihydrolase
MEYRENVWRYLTALAADSASPIDEVAAFDLRESMRNGGGPACLRLRVVLTALFRHHDQHFAIGFAQ